jgi:two-component system chemotaxis response regulator CheY
LARKILLADDSVTAQNMGRKILADAGYEVIAVNNGSAALKKIAELRPDLVILDVYMPGYSGLEVCQRLKEAQETARIPVLLTVGKLEPFKPEEAQRVRAEGYIVKPFEASELLSALSKLEDKIVPRAEPSKPGRFARAIAAAEETDRNGKKEPSSNETGWKNRIAFPSKKTEAEELPEAQSANSAENSDGNKNKETRRHASASEAHVDVAAFAPIGVPKDVTPSEVAAITAAAAQIQMAEASSRKESRDSEGSVSPSASEFAVEPSRETFEDSRDEIQPAPSTELSDEKLRDEKSEDSQGAPVTMAASSESASSGTPRWTAVPVALESDEAAISLDREMHKAYASFATADYATSAGTVEAEAASQDISSTPQPAITEAHSEAPAAEAPAAEAEATLAPEQVVAISSSEPAAVSEPVTAGATIEPSPATDVATPESAPSNGNLVPAVEFSSGPDAAIVDSALAVQAAAEAETETSEPAVATTESLAVTDEISERKPESESVKSTAAAWANWRQIRDTIPSNGEHAEARAEDPEPSAPSAPDIAALAVAAGAENALQDIASAPPNENPTDVASIVDSVLAGLRPKLMEEITRKMSEKK